MIVERKSWESLCVTAIIQRIRDDVEGCSGIVRAVIYRSLVGVVGIHSIYRGGKNNNSDLFSFENKLIECC